MWCSEQKWNWLVLCVWLYFIFVMADSHSAYVIPYPFFFNCTFCVHKIHLFFITYYYCSFLRLGFQVSWMSIVVFLILACISFRNQNLNTAACGFLQKLSMCLLSLSDPSFRACQHGTVCSYTVYIYKLIFYSTHIHHIHAPVPT